ncbi:MAG: hypothetical protein ACRD0Z_05025 [Acidimicrobiales bacterium]
MFVFLGSLATAIAAFAIGAVVSLGTSWLLVSRLERVGERLGLSEALLGLMAALAADSPEITAAVTALVHRQESVGVGVVVGSNVFNLAALLGLGALVAGRVHLHRKVVLLSGVVAVWVAVVCLVSVLGIIDPVAGLVLVLVVMIPYVVALTSHRTWLRRLPLPPRLTGAILSAVDEEALDLVSAEPPRRGTGRDGLVAAAALVVVVAASAFMEGGASSLGRHFGIAQEVVGGLILAAVTSMPNAVAAVHLASRERGAAVLSTALNSNALNVTAGLLVPAIFLGLARPSGAGVLVVCSYVGLTLVTLAMAYSDHGIGRSAGLLVIFLYAAFVASLLVVVSV